MGSCKFFIYAAVAATLALAASDPRPLLQSEEVVGLPEGRWTAPIPSPDGRFLAFTEENYRGLRLLDLQSGKVTTLSEAPGAGFHPTWSPDSRSVAFRTSTGGSSPRLRIVVAHPDGTTETASRLEGSLSLPLWHGEELLFSRFEGETPSLQRVGPKDSLGSFAPPVASPEGHLWIPSLKSEGFTKASPRGKVFFLPVVSSDGKRFVAECLDGHLYLGSPDSERLEDLGPGSYPSFVREGSCLLIERTSDDGRGLTASDIFLMDLQTREVLAVTATADHLERRPRMAGDGHTLFFEDGGRIFRGWVP
jgi:hypothetical protein